MHENESFVSYLHDKKEILYTEKLHSNTVTAAKNKNISMCLSTKGDSAKKKLPHTVRVANKFFRYRDLVLGETVLNGFTSTKRAKKKKTIMTIVGFVSLTSERIETEPDPDHCGLIYIHT